MAGIYRRGQTYWARAQRGGVEHRASLQTTDKAVAKVRFAEWLSRLSASRWGERPRYFLKEAIERFVREHFATLKPSSARRYEVSLAWIEEHFEGKRLDEIGKPELASFETWRRAQGAANPTIRRDLACLSSLFTACEDWEWAEDGFNIVPRFMKRRAKRGLREAAGRRRYLTEAEEAALLREASQEVREAIEWAIDTGLRREEQFSMMLSQTHPSQGTAETTKDTKSRRSRIVPLPPRSARNLAQIRARRFGRVASLYVFAHEDGSRYVHMNKGLKAAASRAKLKDVQWHDLRRTAGCRWLQRDGLTMEQVSMLLGHSSIKVTERCYAFLDGERTAAQTAQKPLHGVAD